MCVGPIHRQTGSLCQSRWRIAPFQNFKCRRRSRVQNVREQMQRIAWQDFQHTASDVIYRIIIREFFLKNTAEQLLISREIQNRFLVWFQFQSNFSAISVINCSTRRINVSAGNTHPRFGCLGLCVRNLHRFDLVRKALWRLIEEFTNGNWLGWRGRV